MLKKISTILLFVFITVIFLSIGYAFVADHSDFTKENSAKEDKKSIEVTLEFWGLWDNSDDWEEIIKKFEDKTHIFNEQEIKVSVNYTKKDFSSYEEDLAKAREKDNEPNIFTINNNWLGQYLDYLESLVDSDAYAEEYGLIKYEELLSVFPAEAIRDLIYKNELYGLPMYSDSLALFYNKDLFIEAGIENPPRTWEEFEEIAKELTLFDKRNNIVQAGAALGCGGNVNRSSDILSLLAMQGGAKVIDSEKNIDLNKEIGINTVNGKEKRTPGKKAIAFYTKFSDQKKNAHIWNCEWEESVKSFADSKTAMFIGYNYQIKNLLVLNPDLNYGVSEMPQLENSTVINFANVWTPVVSKNNNCLVKPAELSDKIDCSKIAWDFLSFAAQKENIKIYLNSTGKAAARKDLIFEQIDLNSKISAFASQAETAISYNKFNDKIDGILAKMIDEICSDRDRIDEIVEKTTGEIEKLKIATGNKVISSKTDY